MGSYFMSRRRDEFQLFGAPPSIDEDIILNQHISPAASHAAVQSLMSEMIESIKKTNETINKTAEETSYTSLQKIWGSESEWPLCKEVSIKLGLECLKKNNDIIVLYAMLADCRSIIGHMLHQPYVGNIGKTRKDGLIDREMGTILSEQENSAYKSFYNSLLEMFNRSDTEKSGVKSIEVDGHTVTKIDKNPDNLTINHCRFSKETYNLLANKINIEFEAYCKSNSRAEILEHIARIAYYFTMAMPLRRGSAATNEMLVQVLLRNKNLPLDYKNKNGIPLDLMAYFLDNMSSFVKHFSENLVPLDSHLLTLADNVPVTIFKQDQGYQYKLRKDPNSKAIEDKYGIPLQLTNGGCVIHLLKTLPDPDGKEFNFSKYANSYLYGVRDKKLYYVNFRGDGPSDTRDYVRMKGLEDFINKLCEMKKLYFQEGTITLSQEDIKTLLQKPGLSPKS